MDNRSAACAASDPQGRGFVPVRFSGVDGCCNRIGRGRPACRPGHGSSQAPFTGGHIGPPLHNAGNVPEITESGVENEHFPNGAGRSPPPTGGAEQSGLRRGAPGVWLPPAKFRNGIWGVSHGHPALRVQRRWFPAKGRCGHRPLRKGEKVSSTTRASGAQRSVCASGCEGGVGIDARTIPKGGPPPRPPRQRLAKRKARKEQLVKFDLCPITSECSTAYNVRKSQ